MTLLKKKMNKLNEKNEQIILGVLSFYEPMTLSKVILDLNQAQVSELGDFSKEDLDTTIKSLESKRLIKAVTVDKETAWIRIHVRRSWLKRLFSL